MMVGWGQNLVLHGLHLISWHILSLLNVWVPYIDVILTSTSKVSTSSWHKKIHARSYIWAAVYKPSDKFKMLRVNLYLIDTYMVSCVTVTKANHVIPCFDIRWKSRGFLFINLLTLILSWSLITTILGKYILLLLKVPHDFLSIYLQCVP